jgi:hypothetical protein
LRFGSLTLCLIFFFRKLFILIVVFISAYGQGVRARPYVALSTTS